MSMDDSKQDKLIDWEEYRRLQKKLRQFNEEDSATLDKNDYLATYLDILEMRKKSFPMLLKEGEAYVFNTPPINCYLLPPIKGIDERWLLVFFVTETNQSQVKIMTWQCNDKQATTIKPLAEQSPITISNCVQRLDNQPSGIECAKAGNTHFINLIFPEGELDLTVSTKTGILSNSWQPTEKENITNVTWIERYSSGQMKTAVTIKHNQSENWQDDDIFDDEGKPLFLSKDNKPEQSLGLINGGDGFEDNPNWVYLASNRFRVFRVDKTGKHQKTRSERFSNAVLDVLAITDKGDSTQLLLVTVHNGAVYLLQDEQKLDPTNNENVETIKIRYWQFTGFPISRLIGQGDEHILSLDQRGRLTPLHLVTNPRKYWAESDKATHKLYNIFKNDITFFLKNPTNELNQQNLPLSKIAFEYLLSQWKPAGFYDFTPALWENFTIWYQWLNNYYSQESTPTIEIIQLHSHLLVRLFHWMQKFCFPPPGYKIKKPNQSNELELALKMIYQLITPKPEAPDVIWTHLLRKSDWVRGWAKKLDLLDSFPTINNDYIKWQQLLWQQRLRIAQGLYRTRPFHAMSSYRFKNHPSFVEVINQDEQLIAVLESNRSLHILKILHDGKKWEELAHLNRKQDLGKGTESWLGQPMFLKKIASNTPDVYRFLIGTHRGDLVILHWQKGTKKFSKELQCNYKNFNIMSYVSLNWHTQQHLLGGKNNNNQPCLYALSNATELHLKSLKLLWGGESGSKGSLRMLKINDEKTCVWGINREAGELLRWKINPSYNNRLVLSQPEIWLKTVHPLNRLGYSAEHDLLICGGQGGLVYALSAKTGALCWLVNIAGDLRHLAYLPCDIKGEKQLKGVWLLSSDDKSSLIVNQEGYVIGTLENTGVVSTFATFKQVLLIGTLDGRLVLMDSQQPILDPAYQAISKVKASLPLHCLETPTKNDLINFLQFNENKETLVATMVLRHFLDFCQQKEATISKELDKAFFNNWEKQSLERQIVFLYELRGIVWEALPLDLSILEFIKKLVNQCWQSVKNFQESSLLCKFISPLFDIIHKLIDEYHCLDNKLLIEMQTCLWCDESTRQHNEDCQQCHVFEKGMALVATRLNQALKCWHKTSNKTENSSRVFDWCNLLYSECRAKDLKTFQQTLHYLFSNNLFLLARDDPWQLWLTCLSGVNQDKVVAPIPLNYLQKVRENPFNKDDFNRLQSLFDNDLSWQQWIQNLQTCLSAVQISRSTVPHEAWRERACWRSLREHIAIQGLETFTVAKDKVLIALWWLYLKQPWLDFIDEKLLQLEQQVQVKPDDYLQVETQERWFDARNAEVSLIITNRFLYSLNLQILYWQGKALDIQAQATQLSADEHNHIIKVDLKGAEDNLLQGSLLLVCNQAESNKKVKIEKRLSLKRNLLELSSDV